MNNNVAKQKTCAKCDDIFTPRSNFAKWCDNCCTYICKQCKEKFMSRRNRKVRFCSLNCTNTWQATSKAKEQARQRTLDIRGSGQIKKCKTCREPFYVPGWRLLQNPKYCSHGCRNYPEDQKGINRILRFPSRPEANKLEKAGRSILDTVSTEYLEQQVIGGKFIVDILIPNASIIVQWDGDFWHGNPAVYPDPTYPVQKTNIRRDKQCNAYLAKCGYQVMRFWESDVHQRPSWVKQEIVFALTNSSRT